MVLQDLSAKVRREFFHLMTGESVSLEVPPVNTLNG
jgi:hypothetical protein